MKETKTTASETGRYPNDTETDETNEPFTPLRSTASWAEITMHEILTAIRHA